MIENKYSIKKFRYHFLIIFISIILSSLSVSYLIKDFYLFHNYRDVIYPPFSQVFIDRYFYLWTDYTSSMNIELPARLWLSVSMLAGNILLAIRLDFIILYIILFFIPYFSFFYLIEKKFKIPLRDNVLVAATLAFIYCLNPFTIQSYSPPYTYVISYSLLPLIIFGAIYFIRNFNLKSKLFISLLITLAITPIVRYIFLVFFLLFITTLLLIIFYEKSCVSIKETLKKYLFIFILLLFFNSYWVLPTIILSAHKTIAPSYIISYETTSMFSSAYNPIDIFTLKASWWPYLKLRPFPFTPEVVCYALLFLVPVLVLFSLLLFNRYEKEEKILLILGALIISIGVFLWKGMPNFNPLFSKIYYSLLFLTPKSIGWFFRVPEYFGGPLVALGYSLCICVLLSHLFAYKNRYKYFGMFLCILIILSTIIVGWQRFTGDLDGILKKGYYFEDREHYDRAPYNKSLILLSDYQGNFKPHHTGKPYIKLPNDLNKYLDYSVKRNDEKTIRYISSLVGADAFITNLEIKNPKLYSLYPESKEGINIYLPKEKIENVYISKYTASSIDFSHNIFGSLSLVNQSIDVITKLDEAYNLSKAEINFDKHSFLIFYNNSLIIKPFDYTKHHNPSKIWSRAMTNDPLHGDWHSYLEKFDIENWQSDYGKGVVFTWAVSKLKEDVIIRDAQIVRSWNFIIDKDFDEWMNYNKERKNYTIRKENATLKAELWESSWGWKTINSPIIEVEYGNWYRFEFKIKTKDAHSVHIKIVEYDDNKKQLRSKHVKSIGSGSLDWQEVKIDYSIEDPEAKYIQMQIWHGHETNQTLPNIVWLDKINIYDLEIFTTPVNLEIPFSINSEDEYVFLARVFQNRKGGEIRLTLNNKEYKIETKDQLNKFVWKKIDTLKLGKGAHKITLSNVKGFNAVNLFAIVPKNEYESILKEIDEIIHNKRIIYIIEAEHDLYHNSTISNNFSRYASNGMVLDLSNNQKALLEIDIEKAGDYIFAVRSFGNIFIKIDEYYYEIASKDLEWNYIGPIKLDKGKQKIEIGGNIYCHETWNFENESYIDWINNFPGGQNFSIDSYAYEGSHSLSAELWISSWGWKTVSSPLIEVKHKIPYQFELYVAGENAYSPHIKIVEYNDNKKLVGAKYILNIDSGKFDWKNLRFNYTPSENASYIQMQIWHGHETNQPIPNKIWIDDVKVCSNSYLDVIWLYSTKKDDKEKLEDIFYVKETKTEVLNYSKINPTLWKVRVNASQPFMLSFAESYDPLWEARVYKNGKKVDVVRAIPLYGVINGFWINTTGEDLEITIRYAPQDWFEVGLLISGLTFILCALYLFYDWRRNKNDRWAKRLEKRFNEIIGTKVENINKNINKMIEKIIAKRLRRIYTPLIISLKKGFNKIKDYW